MPVHAALLVDVVLAITVLEGVALLLFGQRLRPRVQRADWLPSLLAGLCLMGALRSLVHDAGIAWLALWLLAAGAAHTADQWRRWRPVASLSRPAVRPMQRTPR